MKTFLRCAVFAFVVAFLLTYFCYWPKKQTIVLQAGMTKEEVRKAVGRPIGQHSNDCVMPVFVPSFGTDFDHWAYEDVEIGVTYWDNTATHIVLRSPFYFREPPTIFERVRNWIDSVLP